MNFASILPAKTWILLFVGIAATSGFYGKKFYQDIPALKGQQSKLEKSLVELKSDGSTLRAQLQQDPTTVKLATALSDVLLSIMDNRIRYGVTVSGIAPSKATTGGNGGVATFLQMSENVPGTSVPSVRLNLRGTYKGLVGLTGYLNELRSQAVAIVYLKVEGSSFDLGLRVYGNK